METWAPIVGMTMVSVGSAIALVSLGALLYFNWPRSKGGAGAKPVGAVTDALRRVLPVPGLTHRDLWSGCRAVGQRKFVCNEHHHVQHPIGGRQNYRS